MEDMQNESEIDFYIRPESYLAQDPLAQKNAMHEAWRFKTLYR
ncbi:hypothetical protein Bateq7PJ16_3621 [Bacillus subtilis]|nr:hypothetical protein Bateq7PJ16_3621 [Bacillus subtilis]